MHRAAQLAVLALLLLMLSPSAADGAISQHDSTPPEAAESKDAAPVPQIVHVATKPFEPFVFTQDDVHFEGFSIELWEVIAKRLNLKTEYVATHTVKDLLGALRTGKADLAIAGITITSERERDFDFAHPYYRSGLQILVRDDGAETSVLALLGSLFTLDLLKFIGFGTCALIASAHLMWFAERRRNPEFPHTYVAGIWQTFWWAFVTVTTVGYGDKVPRSVPGRLVAMGWMWTGIVLFSFFTATITTTLTVHQLEGEITHPRDLPGHTVATVAGTTTVDFLRSNAVVVFEATSLDDAVDALLDDRVDAVVFDAPVLQYQSIRRWRGKARVIGPVFDQQSYGIALPNHSPLREEISRVVLELIEDGTYDTIHNRWFSVAP